MALLFASLAAAPPLAGAPTGSPCERLESDLPEPATTYEENRRIFARDTTRAPTPEKSDDSVVLEIRQGGAPLSNVLILTGPERRPMEITGPNGRARVLPSNLKDPADRPLWVQTPDGRLMTLLVTVPPDPAAPIALPLPPPATVTGLVRDVVTGRPIPKATVWPENEPWHAAVTDGEGAFTVTTWNQGLLPRLCAGASRYLPADPPVAVPSGYPARRDRGLEIRLHREAILAGRVVDREGDPVAHARVELVLPDGAGSAGPAPVLAAGVSSDDGRFSLPPVAHGTTADIRVIHPRYTVVQWPWTVVTADARPVEVVLDTAPRLRGRVVDSDDAPIAGATVVARLEPVGPLDREPLDAETTTDGAGAFELDLASTGMVTVEARAPGHRTTIRRGIEVVGGGPAEDLELVLPVGASLAGRVLKPDGRGAAGALVSVIPDPAPGGGEPQSVAADERGSFHLADLAPGTVALLADLEGYRGAARRLKLTPGRNRSDLHLADGLEVLGRVVDPEDAPIAGVLVSLTGAPPFPACSSGRSGIDGEFRLSGLTPGSYELSAERPGYVSHHRTVVVRQDGANSLTLRMSVGADLQGRLLGAEPEPARGIDTEIEIDALERGGTAARGRVHIANGSVTYSIRGLAVGIWTVVASMNGGARQARATVVVEPGDRSLIADLDLRTGHTLAGSVWLAGSPFSGARIELVELTGHGAADGVTGVDGRFELSGLADGVYRLTVTDDDATVLHQEPLDLVGDRHLEVNVRASAVTGTVVDVDGAPVVGMLVVFTRHGSPDDASIRSSTGPAGRLHFPRIPAGSYRVAVMDRGQPRLTIPLEVPGDGRTLSLELVVPDLGGVLTPADRSPP